MPFPSRGRSRSRLWAVVLVSLLFTQTAARAQQPGDEVNPFEVPADATNEELVKFIDDLMKARPAQPDQRSMMILARRVFPAIIEATDRIIATSKDDDQLSLAVSRQLEAYSILMQIDQSILQEAQQKLRSYVDDKRDPIAKIGIGFMLNAQAGSMRAPTAEQVATLSNDALDYANRFGLDAMTFGGLLAVAQALDQSDHPAMAGEFYDKFASLAADSSEEAIRARAKVLKGAARRLQLLGNKMEVFGTTADGKSLDWASYRGKVVLVDFWASWCAPCLAEIPNMKRALKEYADKGFTIIGVNLDEDRAAFENCVKTQDISWVNLVDESGGQQGGNEMAAYYGVSSIPTAILVDQEGTVVSMAARGANLEAQLEQLLGEGDD